MSRHFVMMMSNALEPFRHGVSPLSFPLLEGVFLRCCDTGVTLITARSVSFDAVSVKCVAAHVSFANKAICTPAELNCFWAQLQDVVLQLATVVRITPSAFSREVLRDHTLQRCGRWEPHSQAPARNKLGSSEHSGRVSA